MPFSVFLEENMNKPIIYGPGYSTFARSVLMALKEKNQDYDMNHVEMMKGEHKDPAHIKRHPFGKVPSFEHNGFSIYETDAILRYIDDTFPGTKLQPADVQKRTRMNQICSIVNSYLYSGIIMKVFLPRLFADKEKGPDEVAIAEGDKSAQPMLAAVENLLDGQGPHAVGQEFSLADIMLLPIIDYYSQVPEGKKALPNFSKLNKWWQNIQQRLSVKATVPQM